MIFNFKFYNPFAHVMRPNSSFPHSHTLQTDFMKKVEDTTYVFDSLYDDATLGLFGFVEDLKELCAVERETRCALHLMSTLPETKLWKYKNSYILIEEDTLTIGGNHLCYVSIRFSCTRKLYYVDTNGKPEIVKIADFEKFISKLTGMVPQLNKIKIEKIYLSDKELNQLITLNGGHKRPVEPKKNKIQLIAAHLKKLAANVFYHPLRAIDYLGNAILRLIFVFTLTIAMLPIIAIVHAISQTVAWFKRRTAESISIEEEETVDKPPVNFHGSTQALIKQTLGQFLHSPQCRKEIEKLNLEEVIVVEKIDKTKRTATVTISGMSERIGIDQGANNRYCCSIEKKDIPLPEQESELPPIKLKLNTGNGEYIYALFKERNDPRLKALCELNFSIADQLDWKQFFKSR
ncbi:MAG: hypothetical protein A3F42_00405 [Gammaproteobacteria bacterium RIFCSPHIGHO2_12_FULL_37_34]|nr:MAG: hypothetical protein A3F42_00405 [Gammaproteobacteria bacterium RIFCSPHIGHO2_12_FULL_37_34]